MWSLYIVNTKTSILFALKAQYITFKRKHEQLFLSMYGHKELKKEIRKKLYSLTYLHLLA